MTTLEFVLLTLATILLFMIWRLTRHQICIYTDQPEGEIKDLLHSLAGATQGTLLEKGNSVELIQDETFFPAIISAIENAQKTVHVEAFLWEKGEASDKVTQALVDASNRKLWVRVLVDARGSSNIGQHTRDKLESAGVELYNFHPVKIMNFGRFNIRDHRKIIITDGTTAFVGGHCIKDHWLKDMPKFSRFRDITAKLTGPIVAPIQSTFSQNWSEASGQHFLDTETFPALEKTGNSTAHVASVKGDNCPSSVQTLHYLVIALAKKEIRIQNPYFLPDPAGVDAIAKAVKRGVDVKIMTPAPHATDSAFVTHAGRHIYRKLLEAGAEIYEYQKTLLHQKIITVDQQWAGIGSSNFDDRSFKINDEITIGIADQTIIDQLNQIFREDQQHAKQIKLQDWKKRPITQKLKESFYYFFNEQF